MKSNKEFDRSVGIQLYERLQKGFDGKFSVDEFMKVFFIQIRFILKPKTFYRKKLKIQKNI
jgi:hypothetical protein